MVPKIEEKLLTTIKQLDVRVSVTLYELTKKILKNILDFCEDNEVEFKLFGTEKDKFLKQLNLKGDSDGKEIVKNRWCKKSTIIKDGIVNRCCQPLYVYELNNKYNLNLPENIGMNIHDTNVTGEQIKKFVAENTEFCRYCTEPEYYTWKNGRNEAVLNDWVVEE